MITLVLKDVRLSRLPLLVAITLVIAPYAAATAMLYEVYAPDMPSIAVIADYLASAAIFGFLMSIAAAAMVAGNIVACERADGSAIFLACQPVSRTQVLFAKALVVFALTGAIWLVHSAMLYGVAPTLTTDPRSYVHIENPIRFAAALVVLASGSAWFVSILSQSPSLAICAGLAAAFLLPWSIYLFSLAFPMAPDDLRAISEVAQWVVGLLGFIIGSILYVKRAEP